MFSWFQPVDSFYNFCHLNTTKVKMSQIWNVEKGGDWVRWAAASQWPDHRGSSVDRKRDKRFVCDSWKKKKKSCSSLTKQFFGLQWAKQAKRKLVSKEKVPRAPFSGWWQMGFTATQRRHRRSRRKTFWSNLPGLWPGLRPILCRPQRSGCGTLAHLHWAGLSAKILVKQTDKDTGSMAVLKHDYLDLMAQEWKQNF